MKNSGLYLFVFIISIIAVGNLFAQSDPFADKAPQKISNTEVMDKGPNSKPVPIPSDAQFDLIFEYPCAIGGGEAGIETDGIYIYTTKWNGDEFYKYNIDGTFLDTIIISGVSNIRDLAWEGGYFFGGAASPTVYEIDFENEVLISTFVAPTDVRAIAYNDDDDVFYANNWGSDITKFDKAGNNLGSFPVGPVGDSYYGLAYGGWGGGAWLSLWGYAQVGTTLNELVEIELPSGMETGNYFDVGSVASVGTGIAGGLFIHHLTPFYEIIGGISQNEIIWGLELFPWSTPPNDVGVQVIFEPNSGVMLSDEEPVTVRIRNFGGEPQSDISVSFTVDGGIQKFDTIESVLNSGDYIDFTFDSTANLSIPGLIYSIEACTHLDGDDNLSNDCKTKTVENLSNLYGSLEGYLTNCLTGYPIGGATISILDYTTVTTSDGYFYFDLIPVGTWELNYGAPGYCPPITGDMVIIEEGLTTVVDNLCLYPVQFEVDPDTISVSLDPNSTSSETLTISNPGFCDVDWSVSVDFYSDELFDLQFQYPCGVGGGEAGIETDGDYLYTTKWNGDEIYKYGLNGTYIESFTIEDVSNVRDLAWDGTYFYGGAASPTVFEMDFENEELISSFSAPTDVRAIAYDHNNDCFLANNWGSDITTFDKAGTILSSFVVGPVGDSYYGFAYDNVVAGGPFLWGYAQVGNSQNELIQIELSSGIETGIYADVGEYINVSGSALAGGLFTHSNLLNGTWTIGGMVQNEWLWGLELATCQTWLQFEPSSGTLASGASEDMSIMFNSTGILPGVHEADLIFTTNSLIGQYIVHLILTVQGLAPPINLSGYYSCTDICLDWEMPSGSNPDYFNIYRDGELLTSSPGPGFCDSLLIPEVEYCYEITAVYGGDESQVTPEFYITLPTPADLEPLNLIGYGHEPNEGDITLIWDHPTACVSPDGYNIYMDNQQWNIGLVMDTVFIFSGLYGGFYEFYITAVYYFGDTVPSNIAYVLLGGIDEDNKHFSIFPNPVKSWFVIKSDLPLKYIEIFNNQGENIINNKAESTEAIIDMTGYSSGIYILKITTGKKMVFRKIIVK